MISKEKLASLVAYRQKLRHRLEDATPAKHVNRPKQYKLFLFRELESVNKIIELALLDQQK